MVERTPAQLKTDYFAAFAISHLNALRPHYKTGETLGRHPGRLRNVSQHSLAAGGIAKLLCEMFGLPEEEKNPVVDGALLHDWDKKREIFAIDSALKRDELSLDLLDEIKRDQDEKLRRMGISEEVIMLTQANTPETVDGPQTLAEKIVWFADAMLWDTEATPLNERFNGQIPKWDDSEETLRRKARNHQRSELFRERYAGKSLHELQLELGEKIGKEFAERMGYQGEINELPLYLRDKMEERILQQSTPTKLPVINPPDGWNIP